MKLSPAELIGLHCELVRIPSISGDEERSIAFAAEFLGRHGIAVERVGGSLLAWTGGSASPESPFVLLDSHLDTVALCPGWTRDPHAAELEGERIFGLGANDAKASVAAMIAATIAHAGARGERSVALALVRDEERKGAGTAEVVAELARRGQAPAAVVIGEPTGLEIALAQKGLLVLELVERGDAAHPAHARVLAARNAVNALARDLVAIESLLARVEGPLDSLLGRSTVEPTIVSGGSARNVVPAEARAVLDCRTVPTEPPEALRARLAEVVEGELVVLSDRFRPVTTGAGTEVVAAARRARPAAKLYGSATLSDLGYFSGTPAIKIGPGKSERSHRPDEFVTVTELLAGASFYARLLAELGVGTSASRVEAVEA